MTPRPKWWRFTGIAGFKRFMPDTAIQYALSKGHGWPKWYEPVCETCHPDDTSHVVSETDTISVKRTNGHYQVRINDATHNDLSADSVIDLLIKYKFDT